MDALSQLRYRPKLFLGNEWSDVHSLYAITGVPASARFSNGTIVCVATIVSSHLLLTGEFGRLLHSLAPSGYSLKER